MVYAEGFIVLTDTPEIEDQGNGIVPPYLTSSGERLIDSFPSPHSTPSLQPWHDIPYTVYPIPLNPFRLRVFPNTINPGLVAVAVEIIVIGEVDRRRGILSLSWLCLGYWYRRKGTSTAGWCRYMRIVLYIQEIVDTPEIRY